MCVDQAQFLFLSGRNSEARTMLVKALWLQPFNYKLLSLLIEVSRSQIGDAKFELLSAIYPSLIGKNLSGVHMESWREYDNAVQYLIYEMQK